MGDARGAGPDAGALATMWRGVYRKAAAAAEARLQALLGQHVTERHGRRGISLVFDGGGAVLTAGVRADVELPWAYQLEGWALYADAVGSCAVDLLAATPPAVWPAVTSLCGGAPPALSAEQSARSEDLTGWTATALPRGTVLRASVLSAAGVHLVTLTLFVRAV